MSWADSQQLLQRLTSSGLARPDGTDLEARPESTVVGRVGDGQPLFSTDLALGLMAPQILVEGLQELGALHQASKLLLVLRGDQWSALSELRHLSQASKITPLRVDPSLPMDSSSLLADLQARGEELPRHTPVYGATTLHDAGVVCRGEPLPLRTLSLVGALPVPRLLQVPLGSSCAELIELSGAPLGWGAYHNGFCGGARVTADTVVDHSTRGLLVLPERSLLLVHSASPSHEAWRRCASACVRCQICTEVCPVWLNGGTLAPHQALRASLGGQPSSLDGQPSARDSAVLGTLDCLDCHVCDLCCPAQLRPSALIGEIRQTLVDRGVLPAPTTRPPRPERASRRLSIQRAQRMLGLQGFESAPTAAELVSGDILSTDAP